MVYLPDGDIDFYIVIGTLQLAPYLFILCLYYIFWTFIDLILRNCFTLKIRPEANDIPQKFCANYAVDQAHIANNPA